MVAFWILAPIMVVAALGILFARKAVHAAHAAGGRDDQPGGALRRAGRAVPVRGADHRLHRRDPDAVPVRADARRRRRVRLGRRDDQGAAGDGHGRRPAVRRDRGARRRAGVARRRSTGLARRQRRRQRPGPGPAAVQQVRLRLRGDQRAADHRRDRRDGARPPRAAHPEGDAGRPGRPAGCATTPTTASTPARCPRRASTPGTTRWTPRRCCRTARPRRSRSPARSQSRGSVRTAPQDIDALTGSIGDGTSNRPVRGSGPRGGIDGDPSRNHDSEGEDRA